MPSVWAFFLSCIVCSAANLVLNMAYTVHVFSSRNRFVNLRLKMILLLFFPFSCSCLNQCTYCKTKHARGDLGSYPPEEIVARAKQAFEGKPVSEITTNLTHSPFYCSCKIMYFGLHLM